MSTWLADFHQRTDLNKYPIALRTRGGIGYRLPGGETVSTFVGHPVHYLDGGLWKPITLAFDAQGNCDNGYGYLEDGTITYNRVALYKTSHVNVGGTQHKLGSIVRDGNAIVRQVAGYEHRVVFTEKGVSEFLHIPGKAGKVGLVTLTHATPQGLIRNPSRAYDAQGKAHPLDAEGLLQTDEVAAFPAVIDPDYSAHSGDGYIGGGPSASYATARSTSTNFNITNTTMLISHQLVGGDYYTQRALGKYDTSGIPDGDSVSQVTNTLFVIDYSVGTHFDVLIIKSDWSASDPITAGNRETVFDNALADAQDDNIWKNSASVAAGYAYASGNLSTSWINKTGYTYYAYMNSLERANTAPTANNQIMSFATQDHGTPANRPFLTVTHVASSSSGFFLFF